MEGWVDLGCPAMHRPGTELAISRSPVRRSTITLTEQPSGGLININASVGNTRKSPGICQGLESGHSVDVLHAFQ